MLRLVRSFILRVDLFEILCHRCPQLLLSSTAVPCHVACYWESKLVQMRTTMTYNKKGFIFVNWVQQNSRKSNSLELRNGYNNNEIYKDFDIHRHWCRYTYKKIILIRAPPSETYMYNVLCNIFTCRVVRVTIITDSSSDDWFYWHFGYNLS
jgi:hypothetical protein